MAFGTPCTELCERASLAASSTNETASPHIQLAIRQILEWLLISRGESIIMSVTSGWSWLGCAASWRHASIEAQDPLPPRPAWRRQWRPGPTEWCSDIQMHHHIAFEPDDLAAARDPEPIGGNRPAGEFDVDVLVGGDVSLVHVDGRLAEPGLIAGRGLHVDIVMQVEQLVLGVHHAVARDEGNG